jgi:transcriptional regulator with XRE-family HTH domain
MLEKPNRIYELRKQTGLSQEQLGEELGCNKSKISKLENGNQELTQNWMIKIARAFTKHGLSITPSDLLPTGQSYLNENERSYIESYRQLNDSQKAEFDAYFKVIKKKT